MARDLTEPYATVPTHWDRWFMWLLTLLLVIQFTISYLLLNEINNVDRYAEETRQLRIQFEEADRLRQCVLLEEAGVPRVRLEGLGC